jgi:hypothetical protein
MVCKVLRMFSLWCDVLNCRPYLSNMTLDATNLSCFKGPCVRFHLGWFMESLCFFPFSFHVSCYQCLECPCVKLFKHIHVLLGSKLWTSLKQFWIHVPILLVNVCASLWSIFEVSMFRLIIRYMLGVLV